MIDGLTEGGEDIERLGVRILGRTALEDVLDPVTGEVLVEANQQIDETLVEKIENAGIEKVKIRSVLTCQSQRGICATCYGRDLARGHLVNLGEAVGVIAAQSNRRAWLLCAQFVRSLSVLRPTEVPSGLL